MLALLLLLLTFHGASKAATVTRKGYGHSSMFPWPASERVMISVKCTTSLPRVTLYFYQDTNENGYVKFNPDTDELEINCDGAESSIVSPFTPDCTIEENFTYTVQFTTDHIRVHYKGGVLAERKRDGACASQTDQWNLHQEDGRVTATDEGWKFE